jgi:hypothetical protein
MNAASQNAAEVPARDSWSPSGEAYRHTLLSRIDDGFLGRRSGIIVLVVILAAAMILPSVQAVRGIRKVEKNALRAGGEKHGTAIGRWLPSASALVDLEQREDPYGPGHWFPTPPFVLMMLVPLTKLGYTGAGVVWAVLKIVGFVAAMGALISELNREGFGVPVGVLAMAGLFSWRPIIGDLQHGNLNIFMMVWIALTWTFYLRKNDALAGLFLGLAIVTKVTPGLLLLYFLYKRAWRVCGGAVLGLLLFVLVVPGLYLGFARNVELLRSWFDMLVAPFALHGYATLEIENQSLYGVVLRLLSNAGVIPIEEMSSEQTLRVGIEGMARPLGAWALIRPAISLGLLSVLALVCRARAATRRDPRVLLEFAAVLLAMLLMGERTWKHHATTLPIVFLGVWWGLTCLHWSDRFRAVFVVGLVVQWLLLIGGTEGLMGDEVADLLLDGGTFCWGLVLCFAQVGVLLCASPRAAAGA